MEDFLASPFSREKMWQLARGLLDPASLEDGAAGCACAIFETYLNNFTRRNVYETNDVWEDAVYYLGDNLLLIMCNCIQLTSKMISSRSLSSKDLQKYASTQGFYYTRNRIASTEREVYQRVGFDIPPRTNVQEAGILAEQLMLDEVVRTASGYVADIAELRWYQILSDERFGPWKMHHANPFEKENMKILRKLVTAGAVIAAWLLYPRGRDGGDLDSLLEAASNETAVSADHLQRSADVVLQVVLIECKTKDCLTPHVLPQEYTAVRKHRRLNWN